MTFAVWNVNNKKLYFPEGNLYILGKHFNKTKKKNI